MQEYLDNDTRSWRIDDAALDTINDDLQIIINCTAEGDIVLLDVDKVIRPPARIIIPWNLTIRAVTEATDRAGSLPSQSRIKTFFTCPRKGRGVFLVR